MRALLILAAAAGFMALSGPALAQGGGDPGVNGSLTVTPPGATWPYAPYVVAPERWRHYSYWGSAPRGDSLPRYAQSVPDYYWPGPQGWNGFGPGPL